MAESRIIRVSPKRQITIPQEYAKKIGLGNEVECILRDGEIVIRKLVKLSDASRQWSVDDFSDLIIRELADVGYTGDELAEKTEEMKAALKTAAREMVADAIAAAKSDKRDWQTVNSEIFPDKETE